MISEGYVNAHFFMLHALCRACGEPAPPFKNSCSPLMCLLPFNQKKGSLEHFLEQIKAMVEARAWTASNFMPLDRD